MAEYATILRNTANNPQQQPIKTATVGFGKDFAGLNDKRSIIVNGKIKDVVDCSKGSVSTDTRNLCKLGERRGDNEVKTFGDGGFYYTEESSDIAASIVDFASGLVQIINTAPQERLPFQMTRIKWPINCPMPICRCLILTSTQPPRLGAVILKNTT